MPKQAEVSGSVVDTTRGGGRTTVSLPREVDVDIKALGEKMADAVEAHTGIRVEMSAAQIVHATIKKAAGELRAMEAKAEKVETHVVEGWKTPDEDLSNSK